jgi:hypothetical protein
MPATYTGDDTGIAAREDATISEPIGTDVRNATSVQTPLRRLANLVQFLMQHAGLLSEVNEWAATQNITAGNLELVQAALQAILKGGSGKLQIGTKAGNTSDVEIVVGGAVVATLGLGGVTIPSSFPLSAYLRAHAFGSADPFTPLNGDIWYRSDLDKLRARINGTTRDVVVDEAWTALSLAGGWSSGSVAYRRLGSLVLVRGVATVGGSPTSTLATLPAGARPAATRNFVVAQTNGATADGVLQVQVPSGGVIQAFSGTFAAGRTYYFDGIIFEGEQ